MKVFGICPLCDFETEITNTIANYQMCGQCGKIYGLVGNAKVKGVEISQAEKEELKQKSEKLMGGLIDSWRNI